MGAFYGSIHIKTDQVGKVTEALDGLAKRKWKFLMSPVIDGWIAIYPNEHGQSERVSKAIANELEWPILHVVVHDDDVFFYWYYCGGKLIDRFSSCPEYFGQISARMKSLLRGKPERLADLLQDPDDLQRLMALVEEMRTDPLFASDRHEQFARLFGLPNVSTSYEYLMADETEGIDRWDEFVHVPDLSKERKAEQEAAARLERQKDRLKDDGKLLAEIAVASESASVPTHLFWCADEMNGLLIASSNILERRAIPVQRARPPWADEPTPIGIGLPPTAVAMQTSPSGRYLAVGCAGGTWKADLWDLQEQSVMLEVGHTSAVYSAAFTSDERLLFTMSPHEIVATDLGNHKRVHHWKIENGKSIDLHPSGKLIALAKQDGISIFNLESGEERALRLGRYQDLSGLREYLQHQLQQEMEKLGPGWTTKHVEKTLTQMGVPEDSATGKRIREESLKSINDVLSGKAFEHLGERTFQPENAHCVRFVGGGEFIGCATTEGLRVFKTEQVLSAGGGELEPVHSIQPASVPFEYGRIPGQIYAIVDDPRRHQVLFGGVDGTIRSLALTTGETGEFLPIPGEPAITQMQLAGDSALYCLCQPDFFETGPKLKSPLFQIWDVAKLSG